MPFLGFVTTPATPLSYPVYQGLKAAGGLAGSALAAAEATAIAGIVGSAAAALGAGIGGYAIGQMILNSLEVPTVLPEVGDYFEVGSPGGLVRAFFNYYENGQIVFANSPSLVMSQPVRGTFVSNEQGGRQFYFIDGTGSRVNLVATTFPIEGQRIEILNFVAIPGGQPLVPTKRIPSLVPSSPGNPKRVPATVPIPGYPNYPITPEIVPNEDNDPDEEGVGGQPGVVVKIPELGMQITYSPQGVTISKYNDPKTREFKVPPIELPPGTQTKNEEPCCEPEVDLSEVICRIKSLQTEILDDGFNGINGATPEAQAGFYEEFAAVFDKVQIQVITTPSNLRIQPSTSPNQDVWYVGWFAWVKDGAPGLRQPLHFQNQTFIAPPEVSGFSFQLNSGCTGVGRYRLKEKRPYVDNC